MSSILAKFFRSLNSRLITTNNIVEEKFLKIFFGFSVYLYRHAPSFKSHEVIIENFDSDIKMKLDPSRAIGEAIYWTGFHEFREFLFLHRFLQPGMVFIDVGANQGEYTLFAAKRLRQGTVLSFEPLPGMRKVLEENISLNNFTNVSVYACGLSSKNATLQMHEVEGKHEGLGTAYLGDRKSSASYLIDLKPLDEVFIQTSLSRIDFIKIDIEGGELKALQGSERIFQQYKPVVMIEINALTYNAAGYAIDDVIRFFKNIDYRAFEIGKMGILKPCENIPSFGNIIFKPA